MKVVTRCVLLAVFAIFCGFLAAESGASSAAQGAMLRTQLAAEEAAGEVQVSVLTIDSFLH